MKKYVRPPLKWAGGKFRLLERIIPELSKGKRLVEPFVGAGVVFLNTEYPEYLLCDRNEDLINFFRNLAQGQQHFMRACMEFFTPGCNNADTYYGLREKFNSLPFNDERAALFLYLNRHGFNGLVRYNSQGKFNTPFGSYSAPYFPKEEMLFFVEKTQRAAITFSVMDFRETFSALKAGDVVYCDPPYVPLSATANFTSYTAGEFGPAEQLALSKCAAAANAKGCRVVLSNHDTDFSRTMYTKAKIMSFPVQRLISCSGANRGKAQELLVTYA